MRVTQSMITSRSIQHINQNFQKLHDLQNQASTGKKYTRPSQNPSAAMAAHGYRSQAAEIEQFQRNTSQVNNWLADSEAALDQTAGSLQRVRELSVQAANGSYTPEDRTDIAAEVKEIRNHIVTLANSQSNGKYLFNGTDTGSKPVNDDMLSLSFTEGPFADWLEEGGEEAGPYAVYFGGERYEFETGDEQIAFRNENGERITVDGLPDSPAFTREWTEETEEGPALMTEAVEAYKVVLSSSEGVSRNGDPVAFEMQKGVNIQANVDPQSVFNAGLFADLTVLEEALRNPETSEDTLNELIGTVNGRLDEVVNARSELGARQVRVDMITDRVNDQELLTKRMQSENEDADMSKVITELMARENIHQASLASSARIMQPSLLDFLR
ncbi:flagellar hook-associated protein FlgL [Alteribacter natronophilus]|uniref:flagellar hook-associated protein FlgL n=1 Tax=Alteribacter natronophilus TaxID=2583810 RepID=UPI00110EEF0E|nr:flagellar hook-associated protein FlgL [Alteribacter natronophilus]TMW72375.1 flagellar hook-associated protein 3 [Alteribacter natronophilus]